MPESFIFLLIMIMLKTVQVGLLKSINIPITHTPSSAVLKSELKTAEIMLYHS